MIAHLVSTGNLRLCEVCHIAPPFPWSNSSVENDPLCRKRSSWRDPCSCEPQFLQLKKSTPKNKNKHKTSSLQLQSNSMILFLEYTVLIGNEKEYWLYKPCHFIMSLLYTGRSTSASDIPTSQGSTWCRRLAAKGYTELGPFLLSPTTKSLQSAKDNCTVWIVEG